MSPSAADSVYEPLPNEDQLPQDVLVAVHELRRQHRLLAESATVTSVLHVLSGVAPAFDQTLTYNTLEGRLPWDFGVGGGNTMQECVAEVERLNADLDADWSRVVSSLMETVETIEVARRIVDGALGDPTFVQQVDETVGALLSVPLNAPDLTSVFATPESRAVAGRVLGALPESAGLVAWGYAAAARTQLPGIPRTYDVSAGVDGDATLARAWRAAQSAAEERATVHNAALAAGALRLTLHDHGYLQAPTPGYEGYLSDIPQVVDPQVADLHVALQSSDIRARAAFAQKMSRQRRLDRGDLQRADRVRADVTNLMQRIETDEYSLDQAQRVRGEFVARTLLVAALSRLAADGKHHSLLDQLRHHTTASPDLDEALVFVELGTPIEALLSNDYFESWIARHRRLLPDGLWSTFDGQVVRELLANYVPTEVQVLRIRLESGLVSPTQPQFDESAPLTTWSIPSPEGDAADLAVSAGIANTLRQRQAEGERVARHQVGELVELITDRLPEDVLGDEAVEDAIGQLQRIARGEGERDEGALDETVQEAGDAAPITPSGLEERVGRDDFGITHGVFRMQLDASSQRMQTGETLQPVEPTTTHVFPSAVGPMHRLGIALERVDTRRRAAGRVPVSHYLVAQLIEEAPYHMEQLVNTGFVAALAPTFVVHGAQPVVANGQPSALEVARAHLSSLTLVSDQRDEATLDALSTAHLDAIRAGAVDQQLAGVYTAELTTALAAGNTTLAISPHWQEVVSGATPTGPPTSANDQESPPLNEIMARATADGAIVAKLRSVRQQSGRQLGRLAATNDAVADRALPVVAAQSCPPQHDNPELVAVFEQYGYRRNDDRRDPPDAQRTGEPTPPTHTPLGSGGAGASPASTSETATQPGNAGNGGDRGDGGNPGNGGPSTPKAALGGAPSSAGVVSQQIKHGRGTRRTAGPAQALEPARSGQDTSPDRPAPKSTPGSGAAPAGRRRRQSRSVGVTARQAGRAGGGGHSGRSSAGGPTATPSSPRPSATASRLEHVLNSGSGARHASSSPRAAEGRERSASQRRPAAPDGDARRMGRDVVRQSPTRPPPTRPPLGRPPVGPPTSGTPGPGGASGTSG